MRKRTIQQKRSASVMPGIKQLPKFRILRLKTASIASGRKKTKTERMPFQPICRVLHRIFATSPLLNDNVTNFYSKKYGNTDRTFFRQIPFRIKIHMKFNKLFYSLIQSLFKFNRCSIRSIFKIFSPFSREHNETMRLIIRTEKGERNR